MFSDRQPSHLAPDPPQAMNKHLEKPVTYVDILGSDPKPHAQQWLCNNKAPLHLCNRMEDVWAHPDGFWCVRHKKKCTMDSVGDVFVAGFPCSPFSSQRSNRSAPGLGCN